MDNNQRHEVVFKFMKNKDQFDREIDAREKVRCIYITFQRIGQTSKQHLDLFH